MYTNSPATNGAVQETKLQKLALRLCEQRDQMRNLNSDLQRRLTNFYGPMPEKEPNGEQKPLRALDSTEGAIAGAVDEIEKEISRYRSLVEQVSVIM